MATQGLVRSLDGFKETLATKPQREFKKVNWLRWEKIAQGEYKPKLVRFLQEIDPSADGYDENLGLAALAVVHSPPVDKGWQHRFVIEEGDDEVASMVRDWDRKTRVYINVLVDGEVQLWDAPKSVAKQLLEFTSEVGTITDRAYKVKRSGEQRDTQYMFFPQMPEALETDGIETFDIEEDVVRLLDTETAAKFNEEAGIASSDDDDSWTLGG